MASVEKRREEKKRRQTEESGVGNSRGHKDARETSRNERTKKGVARRRERRGTRSCLCAPLRLVREKFQRKRASPEAEMTCGPSLKALAGWCS